MDFVIGLLVFFKLKNQSSKLIFITIDQFTKMIYYESIKVIINTLGLAKVIINVLVRYHRLSNSIINDYALVYSSQFLLILYYFLGIKQKFFTTFHAYING